MNRKNNIVPLHSNEEPSTQPSTAQFVPIIQPPVLPPVLPPGYVFQPTVTDGMINGLDEVQGPTVIDYIAKRDRISLEAACEGLKQKLVAGRLKARGPTGRIKAKWWRYTTITVDGTVTCLKPMGVAPWFIVRASDVIALWPPPPDWVDKPSAPIKPVPGGVTKRPQQAVVDAAATDFIRQYRAAGDAKAIIKNKVRPSLRAMVPNPHSRKYSKPSRQRRKH